jgi:hypothetical protein
MTLAHAERASGQLTGSGDAPLRPVEVRVRAAQSSGCQSRQSARDTPRSPECRTSPHLLRLRAPLGRPGRRGRPGRLEGHIHDLIPDPESAGDLGDRDAGRVEFGDDLAARPQAAVPLDHRESPARHAISPNREGPGRPAIASTIDSPLGVRAAQRLLADVSQRVISVIRAAIAIRGFIVMTRAVAGHADRLGDGE